MIKTLPFQRLVHKIASLFKPGVRLQSTAILALQEAAEAYIIDVYQESKQCANYAKRVTITSKDIRLAQRMRGYRLIDSLQPEGFVAGGLNP